jgi:hypothetical protein
MEARGIGRAEENPLPGATPDLANVSLVAGISATTPRDTMHIQFLWAMARTNWLVAEYSPNAG